MEASTKYFVVRTTTEQLADAMNKVVADGCYVESSTWVGGRDWIIVARVNYTFPKGGWADDMERRHARFDESPYASASPFVTADPSEFTSLIDPEIEHGDIIYGRYDETRVPTGHRFSGWIENYAKTWIIFIGEHGAPSLYYPRRDEAGGVIGEPINLAS